MLKQCPRCENEEIKGANYCKICGLKLKEAPEVPAQEQNKTIRCLNCNKEIERFMNFCPYCQEQLKFNNHKPFEINHF